MDCHGEDKDKCNMGINGIFPVYNPKFSVNISFDGNGPIHVQWYLNGTEFDCAASHSVCLGIAKGTTFQVSVNILNKLKKLYTHYYTTCLRITLSCLQTVTFRSYDIEDALKIAGSYKAVVSNPYGTNESLFRLEYSCEPTRSPQPIQDNKEVLTLNLVEGSKLDFTSCGVVMDPFSLIYACFARFDNMTIDDLSISDCVTCEYHKCAYHVNSTFSDVVVSKLRTGDCPPVQHMNFMKENISLSDNGTKIICAYSTHSSVIPYQSIILNVSPLLPDDKHNVVISPLH